MLIKPEGFAIFHSKTCNRNGRGWYVGGAQLNAAVGPESGAGTPDGHTSKCGIGMGWDYGAMLSRCCTRKRGGAARTGVARTRDEK